MNRNTPDVLEAATTLLRKMPELYETGQAGGVVSHGSHPDGRRQRAHGTIPISGAKNAALPLMIASLLTEDPLMLENVPRLADVKQLERILENHGVDIGATAAARAQNGG